MRFYSGKSAVPSPAYTQGLIFCRAVPVGSHRQGWAKCPCSCGSLSGIHKWLSCPARWLSNSGRVALTRRHTQLQCFINKQHCFIVEQRCFFHTIQFMMTLIIISFSSGLDSATMIVRAASVWSAIVFCVFASSRNNASFLSRK